MTACSDDKKELKIIVEPTSFHFEQTGGSKKFGITPNEPATFQSSEAWCKVTSESSTPVQAIYNITVEPNTTPDVRNAIITVSVKEHIQEINVEQAAYIQSDEPEKYTVRENLTTHQQMTFGVVAATVSYYVDKELVEVVHVSQCLCLVGFTTAPRSPNLIVSDFIHWLEQ